MDIDEYHNQLGEEITRIMRDSLMHHMRLPITLTFKGKARRWHGRQLRNLQRLTKP